MKKKISKILIFFGISLFIFYLGVVIGYNLSLYGEVRKIEKEKERIEAAIREHYLKDIYGGKTPQETLNMFIEALRKEDLELALKYVDENERKEAGEKLEELKEKGYLDQFIENLTKVKPSPENEEPPIIPTLYGFELRDEEGYLILAIGLRQNEYNKLWKITGF